MTQPINIDEDICISCGVCARVCPCGTIVQNKEEKPKINEEARCIACGQCDAFCPTEAVECEYTGDYPARDFDGVREISSKELARCFQRRRTIRHYKSNPIPREKIEEILEVVRYAPTGGNVQPVHWTIISDQEKLKVIGEAVAKYLKMAAEKMPDSPYKEIAKNMAAAYEDGHNVITWGAPHLVAVSTDMTAISGDADGIIALSWFEIALQTYGLGAVWLGLLKMAALNSPEIMKLLAIPEKTKLQYTMVFGEPSMKVQKIPKRNVAKVYWH